MKYLWTALTDIGERESNQDSVLVRQAVYKGRTVVLAVVCDGMGGLKKGEVASAFVVQEFSAWFEDELPVLIRMDHAVREIHASWMQLIHRMHEEINQYAKARQILLGTTLTAMLFFENHYELLHVGDSRAYEISEFSGLFGKARRLTKDQTLAEREVACGRMKRQEAEEDQRRHILLQSVGGCEKVEPVYRQGRIRRHVVYLLCSDGCCHKISERELQNFMHPKVLISERVMEARSRQLIAQNKVRGEQDNLSVIAIRTY